MRFHGSNATRLGSVLGAVWTEVSLEDGLKPDTFWVAFDPIAPPLVSTPYVADSKRCHTALKVAEPDQCNTLTMNSVTLH
jgi:hypothetical protein